MSAKQKVQGSMNCTAVMQSGSQVVQIRFCTHDGTRTHNLTLRRGTPYPLGHAGCVVQNKFVLVPEEILLSLRLVPRIIYQTASSPEPQRFTGSSTHRKSLHDQKKKKSARMPASGWVCVNCAHRGRGGPRAASFTSQNLDL